MSWLGPLEHALLTTGASVLEIDVQPDCSSSGPTELCMLLETLALRTLPHHPGCCSAAELEKLLLEQAQDVAVQVNTEKVSIQSIQCALVFPVCACLALGSAATRVLALQGRLIHTFSLCPGKETSAWRFS